LTIRRLILAVVAIVLAVLAIRAAAKLAVHAAGAQLPGPALSVDAIGLPHSVLSGIDSGSATDEAIGRSAAADEGRALEIAKAAGAGVVHHTQVSYLAGDDIVAASERARATRADHAADVPLSEGAAAAAAGQAAKAAPGACTSAAATSSTSAKTAGATAGTTATGPSAPSTASAVLSAGGFRGYKSNG
jgi:hypothetical protein